MSRSIVFDRAAGYYDETRGFPPGVPTEMAATLAHHLHLTKETRVLEIGVGTGRIALPLRPHVGFYVGVDLSRPMMEVLRAKEGEGSIALVQGDVSTLPLASASVDLALAIHLLHLVAGWRDAVRELGRVVRPGGAVVINRWNAMSEIVGRWRDLLAEHGVTEKGHTVGERDVDVVGEALAAEGFSLREDGVAAEWPSETRPSETVETLSNRVWSSTWNIPEPTFSRALADLRDWVGERYPDPEQPIPETAQFSYALFRRHPL